MNTIDIASTDAKHIYNFWKNLLDKKNGGFYGEVDFNLNIHKEAYKGVILNSRILYFFSEYYLNSGDKESLVYAKAAYDFLIKAVDTERGGLYWSLDYQGNPLDTTKHTYNIAFGIYALSHYYLATKNEKALDLALSLYNTIETNCREKDGNRYYLEEQTKNFTFKPNDELSENGVLATRTMNTALHVLEAYSALYEASHSLAVKKDLTSIINLFLDKIYNPNKKRLEVFFDADYHSLIDLESYGHEIETSWLLKEASDEVNDPLLAKRVKKVSLELVESVSQRAYQKPFIINECENGRDDTTRVWWIQAEGVNGYLNAYQMTKNVQYYNLALEILGGIQEYFIDKRENSEWFWDLNGANIPSSHKDIVEPWKCPYHNGRMCFEIKKRLSK